MKKFATICLLVTVLLALAASPVLAKQQKAAICHFAPPGSDSGHVIVIAAPAVRAHLEGHPGDFVITWDEPFPQAGSDCGNTDPPPTETPTCPPTETPTTPTETPTTPSPTEVPTEVPTRNPGGNEDPEPWWVLEVDCLKGLHADAGNGASIEGSVTAVFDEGESTLFFNAPPAAESQWENTIVAFSYEAKVQIEGREDIVLNGGEICTVARATADLETSPGTGGQRPPSPLPIVVVGAIAAVVFTVRVGPRAIRALLRR